MSGQPRLGTPIELPWWVIPMALPPAVVTVLAPFLGAPGAVRAVAAVASVLLVAVIAGVALRVASRNLQSVWISTAYALWFFVALGWAVEVLNRPR